MLGDGSRVAEVLGGSSEEFGAEYFHVSLLR